jgi:hypothetical protein
MLVLVAISDNPVTASGATPLVVRVTDAADDVPDAFVAVTEAV